MNRTYHKLIGACVVACATTLGANVMAQDTHFSLIDNTPLFQNPATTGAFNGDQRGSLHYRNQWKSADSPFQTIGAAVDLNWGRKDWDNGYLSTGLSFFSDKAGDNNLAITKADLSIAYHIETSSQSYFTAAVSVGMTQNSIDESSMTWDNQYDGTGYNSSLPSGENRSFAPFTRFDAGAGILWRFSTSETYMSSNDGVTVQLGGGVYHVNQPAYSLYAVEGEKQFMKIVGHGTSSFGINNSNIAIRPAFLLAFQGPSSEIVVGSMFRLMLQEGSKFTGNLKETAVAIGANYRLGDAVIPSLLVEYGQFAFQIGYDLNLSDLSTATNGQGGIELMLRFTNPNPFGRSSSRL